MTLTTALLIRRHINGLKQKQIFSIRDLLPYGSRGAVDLAMHRLVKNEIVFRVARGLYVRNYDAKKAPDDYVVSKIKAQAFAKETSSHGKKCVIDNRLLSFDPSSLEERLDLIYATTGSTSTFQYNNRNIKFHKQAPRKLILAGSPVGDFIRALWTLGPHYCYRRRTGSTIDFKKLINSRFNPYEQEELRMARKWMPAWLANRLFAHQQVYFPKFQPIDPSNPAQTDTITDYYGLENWGWTFSNRS